jgi:hypothetical protein
VAKEIPIACSLDAEGLGVRHEEIRALGASFHGRSNEGGAVVLRFDLGARDTVADLIRMERECCPFFDFDLTERDGELRLRVTAPAQAAPVLEEFVAAFGA